MHETSLKMIIIMKNSFKNIYNKIYKSIQCTYKMSFHVKITTIFLCQQLYIN